MQCKIAVDRPPHAVEDVKEVVRVIAVDRDAARKGAVDVVVGVNQPRQDHPAVRVDELGAGPAPAQLIGCTDGGDNAAVGRDTAVFDQAVVFSAGDQPSVSNKQQGFYLP